MEHSNIQHLNMQKEAEGTISGNSTAIQRTDEQMTMMMMMMTMMMARAVILLGILVQNAQITPSGWVLLYRFWTITGNYATYKGGKLQQPHKTWAPKGSWGRESPLFPGRFRLVNICCAWFFNIQHPLRLPEPWLSCSKNGPRQQNQQTSLVCKLRDLYRKTGSV